MAYDREPPRLELGAWLLVIAAIVIAAPFALVNWLAWKWKAWRG